MSLSDDAQNKFNRRKPQMPTSQEQKNKFDREEDRRNARRGNTTAHDARVQKIAEQNTNWVHKNFQPVAAGGTPLPPDLAKLKSASDASRTAPKAAPVSVNLETVAALIRDWKQNSASGKNLLTLFEENDWNRVQLTEMTQHLLKAGHPVNADLPERAFQLCYAGNHLDPKQRRDRAGNVIRLRGEAARPAPIAVPHCVWEDEAAAIQEEQAQQALATAATEAARARSLPFDQLKKEATKDRKPASPMMGPMVS
jgi:hypothetical protein